MAAKKTIYEYGLQVLGYEFLQGRELLEGLVQNKARRYPFRGAVEGFVRTNQGALYFKTEPDFVCDMRSGPKIIDWYVPNLGSIEERLAWFVHDLLGYGQSLNFTDTNIMLFVILRDMAKYRYVKAKLVQAAVSISDSWYGTPKPSEWCYANIGKVLTEWREA